MVQPAAKRMVTEASLDPVTEQFMKNPDSKIAKHLAGLLTKSSASSLRTFGDLMRPYGREQYNGPGTVQNLGLTSPGWYATTNAHIRWDDVKAFEHASPVVAFGTLATAAVGSDVRQPAVGCEIVVGPSYKSQDVRFTVSGKKWAIRWYNDAGSGVVDCNVWLDGKPVAEEFISGTPGGLNWIQFDFPTRRKVEVRFAGPIVFTGVDYDTTDPVYVVKAKSAFKMAVVSDSYFEMNTDPGAQSRTGAVALSTATGITFNNQAMGGTGWLNTGGGYGNPANLGYPPYVTSEYGSTDRYNRLINSDVQAVMFNGGFNDGPPYTVAALLAETRRVIRKLAVDKPKWPVVIVGFQPTTPYNQTPFDVLAGSPGEAITAAYTALLTEPNVVGLIDPFTPQILTGNGKSSAKNSNGNQDYFISTDGIHLNGDGGDWYMGWVAQQLAALPVEFKVA